MELESPNLAAGGTCERLGWRQANAAPSDLEKTAATLKSELPDRDVSGRQSIPVPHSPLGERKSPYQLQGATASLSSLWGWRLVEYVVHSLFGYR